MKQTAMPFYETGEDATTSAILRSGKCFKEVAQQVRPELKAESAYAWLKNALRPDAREKLTVDQHILIANFCQEYDFLYYCAQACHHSQPEPVCYEDEFASLQRAHIDAIGRLDEITRRMERISEGRSTVQAVKTR